MDDSFKELIARFKEINKLGYIKGVNNIIYNSCGLTFEKLLNKKTDDCYFPDYYGIEIKTKQRYSRYDIKLFSISFDGPDLFESDYIIDKYGYYTNNYDKKELMINLKYQIPVLTKSNYYFELSMDETSFFINIYDSNMNFLEKRGIIYYSTVNERINIKLKKLALIYGSKKVINNNLFFRYYRIQCGNIKSFDVFKSLIKSKEITFALLLRYGKSEKYFGKNKNNNLIFKIKKDKIEDLYDIFYNYEN